MLLSGAHLDDGHSSLQPLSSLPHHVTKQPGQDQRNQRQDSQSGRPPPITLVVRSNVIRDLFKRRDKTPPADHDQEEWHAKRHREQARPDRFSQDDDESQGCDGAKDDQ